MAESRDQNSSRAMDLISLIAPAALLVVFLILKAYAVANYNLTTATALVIAQPISVLVGTLATFADVLLAIVAILFVCLFVSGLSSEGGRRRKLVPVYFVLAIFTCLLSPWPLLVDGAVCAFLVFLPHYLLMNSRRVAQFYTAITHSRVMPSLKSTALPIALTLFMLLFLATLRTPWLPPVVLMLKNPVSAGLNPGTESPPFSVARYPVVFIVSENSEEIDVLMDQNRKFVWTSEANVLGRDVCSSPGQIGGEPLFEVLLSGSHSYGPNFSCFLRSDQPQERAKANAKPPFIVQLLEWNW